MSRPTLDPVVWVVNSLSRWAWQQMVRLAGKGLKHTLFAPLPWPSAVMHLYSISRDAALGTVGVVLLVAVLRSMWPELALPGLRLPLPVVLERLLTAALMATAGIWAVRMMLTLNNAAVAAIIGGAGSLASGAAPQGSLSPLAVLLTALALIGIVLYLAVFYAARMIELYLLTAAIPWFAMAWAAFGDDRAIGNLLRELVVVVFVQTLHAACFWLAVQLVGSRSLGNSTIFLEVALFWYMTRVPAQFRRLAGAGWGVTRLWR
ncbi:hypothetical protein [Sulfobacillus harzensis]|uniref:Uncharacterized protein n=1 Tax=Sulfobacillus harzensis TaxID=2729629 RepID=A0A7Y0L3E1_9FIRM|nr:hypothetical protein [Sulfobacillus harzensis]NMP22574.1 hypothetical protein [Sulfobacillus harzensis]